MQRIEESFTLLTAKFCGWVPIGNLCGGNEWGGTGFAYVGTQIVLPITFVYMYYQGTDGKYPLLSPPLLYSSAYTGSLSCKKCELSLSVFLIFSVFDIIESQLKMWVHFKLIYL